jgi:hypothetical protein
LRPDTHIAEGARAWRTYRLLQLRYVEARDPADVEGQLAMSKSQYYREHEHALETLATLLWEQVSERSGPAPSGTRLAVETRDDHPPHNLPIEVTSFIGRHK